MHALSLSLPRSQAQPPGMESDGQPAVDATIAGAVERGASSENFDLSANVDSGDDREVDPALFKMEAIMSERGCTFDEAREIYNREKMLEAGIDPDSGLSTDPKAVHSSEAFAAVFDEGSAVEDLTAFGQRSQPGHEGQWPPLVRVRARARETKAYWRAQSNTFGAGL